MPRGKRPIRLSSSVPEDSQRTLAEWSKMTAEMLRLKLNQYNLVQTGTKQVLVHRLFDYFVENQSLASNSNTNVLSSSDPENISSNVNANEVDFSNTQVIPSSSETYSFVLRKV